MRKKSKNRTKSRKSKNRKKSKNSLNPFMMFLHGKTKQGKSVREELTRKYNREYSKSKDAMPLQNFLVKKMSELWNESRK
jgi:hypothetical protein